MAEGEMRRMSSTGLSERELDMIRGVFARNPEITGASLFGSRAKGTAQASSDIDIVYRFNVQVKASYP